MMFWLGRSVKFIQLDEIWQLLQGFCVQSHRG